MSEDVLGRLIALERDHHALAQRLTDALDARDKALDVALKSLTQHLAVMNEFRGAMGDQQRNFVTRDELHSAGLQINDLRLAMRDVAAQYVPKIDMNLQADRISITEKTIADLHTRYATLAIVFSVGVIVINLTIDLWPHITR